MPRNSKRNTPQSQKKQPSRALSPNPSPAAVKAAEQDAASARAASQRAELDTKLSRHRSQNSLTAEQARKATEERKKLEALEAELALCGSNAERRARLEAQIKALKESFESGAKGGSKQKLSTIKAGSQPVSDNDDDKPSAAAADPEAQNSSASAASVTIGDAGATAQKPLLFTASLKGPESGLQNTATFGAVAGNAAQNLRSAFDAAALSTAASAQTVAPVAEYAIGLGSTPAQRQARLAEIEVEISRKKAESAALIDKHDLFNDEAGSKIRKEDITRLTVEINKLIGEHEYIKALAVVHAMAKANTEAFFAGVKANAEAFSAPVADPGLAAAGDEALDEVRAPSKAAADNPDAGADDASSSMEVGAALAARAPVPKASAAPAPGATAAVDADADDVDAGDADAAAEAPAPIAPHQPAALAAQQQAQAAAALAAKQQAEALAAQQAAALRAQQAAAALAAQQQAAAALRAQQQAAALAAQQQAAAALAAQQQAATALRAQQAAAALAAQQQAAAVSSSEMDDLHELVRMSGF